MLKAWASCFSGCAFFFACAKYWVRLNESNKMKNTKISVIGLGFVGLSLAVINAKKGFPTIGIDSDKKKIKKLTKSKDRFLRT